VRAPHVSCHRHSARLTVRSDGLAGASRHLSLHLRCADWRSRSLDACSDVLAPTSDALSVTSRVLAARARQPVGAFTDAVVAHYISFAAHVSFPSRCDRPCVSCANAAGHSREFVAAAHRLTQR